MRVDLGEMQKDGMSRIYFPCFEWEDWLNGMYRIYKKDGDGHLIGLCISLLSDTEKLRIAMLTVTNKWVNATEVNLTNLNQNRRAWLGWAACSLNHNAPHMLTRAAWGRLTEYQRTEANLVADRIIYNWEDKYLRGKGILCLPLIWE